MTNIPIGTAKVTFQCQMCGPTKLVVPDGHTNDSVCTCKTCGRELGTFGAIREQAKAKVADQAIPAIRDAVRRALKGL